MFTNIIYTEFIIIILTNGLNCKLLYKIITKL